MHLLIFKKHGICKNLYKILVHVREHFVSIHYHQRKVMKELYLLLTNDILEFTMLAILMLWLEQSAFQAHNKLFDHMMYARERFRAICRVVDHQTSDHLCSWINPFAAEGVFYTGQAARWFSVRKREHANLMTCPWKEKNQLPSYEWFRHTNCSLWIRATVVLEHLIFIWVGAVWERGYHGCALNAQSTFCPRLLGQAQFEVVFWFWQIELNMQSLTNQCNSCTEEHNRFFLADPHNEAVSLDVGRLSLQSWFWFLLHQWRFHCLLILLQNSSLRKLLLSDWAILVEKVTLQSKLYGGCAKTSRFWSPDCLEWWNHMWNGNTSARQENELLQVLMGLIGVASKKHGA